MRFTARAVLLVSIPLLLAACATGPNQIVARDPLPPPPPGYRVVCDTSRAPFYLYQASCRPAVPAATALQVRG
jgi:hypothetical protein